MSLGDAMFKLWDAGPTEEPQTLYLGKHFVLYLAFSADGRRLWTHDRCWDTATGGLLAQLPSREGWEANAWIAPDPAFEWVTAGVNGALLRQGEAVVRTAAPLQFRPATSPDGRLFAVGLERGALQVFTTDDGRLVCDVALDTSVKHAGGVAFTHDCTRVVTWTGGGHWTIWDIASGDKLVAGRHGVQYLVSVAFSFDDRLLATASYDGATRIYDARTGAELHTLRPAGGPSGDQGVVWSVAFSPDGARLATGSKDRRIRLWDVATGREVIALPRHAGTVMCLAWSPDGAQLASGGYEGAVCLWDALSRSERRARARQQGPAESEAPVDDGARP
jgi:dipeptidyl aminopeptidase/acylaminoacyl peptidase